MPHRYLPSWPQPGLRARDPSRGATFRNVMFFGEEYGLNPEIADKSFKAWCDANDLEFRCVERSKWYDYSDCDVVLAIRSFNNESTHSDKPASKLVNAWLAGVPAILGGESAYRFEGTPGEDYLEALTIDDVKEHLLNLKTDAVLATSIVKRSGPRKLDSVISASSGQAASLAAS